ncbi:hypothetical protein HPB48_020371 [Haemaphysalis longicornis]|uniref:C2H2-type domain-containing protein n=1 Tax=Haemaphysalis longicornis TaxID=44386 RepID=A0A9J6H1J2_HAELO|nr:hypothetical protein HPB48_020371 [Haemaphysalis longicornis]
MARHRKLHARDTESYVCPYCSRLFPQKNELKRHIMSHSGERPHACRVCGQRFRDASHAKRHEKTVHGGPGPMTCQYCGCVFPDMWNLTQHLRIQHRQEAEFTQ